MKLRKKQDYLGIYPELIEKGEFKVIMTDNLMGVIGEFPEEIIGTYVIPKYSPLFDIQNNCANIGEEQAM